MKKRVLSLITMLCLLFVLLPTTAFAEDCAHETVEILYTGMGEFRPNCTEKGRGHKECTKCHAVIESNIRLPALGHADADKNHVCDREDCKARLFTCSGGTATCKDKAVCEHCGEKYGNVDPDNHAGELTWTIDGKTHEQKCEACGEIVVKNEKHSFLWGTCEDCGYVSNFRIVFSLCRVVWEVVRMFDKLVDVLCKEISGWFNAQ